MRYRKYTIKERLSFLLKLIPLFFILMVTCHLFINAENLITRGTSVVINSGSFVTSEQGVVVENGGTLQIEGTLILRENLTNQNPVANLGTGTIEFSGSTPQRISGENIIGSIVVNNPAGLDINGAIQLNTNLTLLDGHIRLGEANLTLGAMALVTGLPSQTAMVVATGNGEIRKIFTNESSFTFPVGDDSEVSEYSPVTLSFLSGSFTPTSFAGVNLKNSVFAGLSGNGLKRYWSIEQNGITGFRSDLLFQYLPADINFPENKIKCIRANDRPFTVYSNANTQMHQLTANGVTTFGTFTGEYYGISENLLLNDLNLTNNTPSCFNAYDSIAIAGNSMVKFISGTSVELIAGKSIRFLPGFHAQEGSYAYAHITTNSTFCDGSAGSIVQNPKPEKSVDLNINQKIVSTGKIKEVKVYPNPNNGNFTLEYSNLNSGAEIRIFNSIGATVYRSMIKEHDQQKINLSGIHKGLYFVKIMDGVEQMGKKMVVE